MKIIICVIVLLFTVGCNSTPSVNHIRATPSIIMPGALEIDCSKYRENWWATQRRKIVIFLFIPHDYHIIDACKKRGFKTKDILMMGAVVR